MNKVYCITNKINNKKYVKELLYSGLYMREYRKGLRRITNED